MVTLDQKPLIVLVHGGASSQRMYRTTIPLLQDKGFECLTLDLPGHGTASENGPFTFEGARKAVNDLINIVADAQIARSTEPDAPGGSIAVQVILVGISLGGQVVLSFLENINATLHSNVSIMGAIVSGAFIHPPDEDAGFEMPHLPTDQAWMDIIMEDVQIAGMENMPDLQAKSMAFTFDAEATRKNFELVGRVIPSVQIMIGENDVAMAKRDFEELTMHAKKLSARSENIILKGAWHNHSIDVPEQFADAVADWAARMNTV